MLVNYNIFFFVLLSLMYSLPVAAEQSPIQSMNRIVVAEPNIDKESKKEEKEQIHINDLSNKTKESNEDIDSDKEESKESEIKSVSVKKEFENYILETKDLIKWKYVADLYEKNNNKLREKALELIDNDLSVVPPLFLYEASKIYAKKGNLEKASTYFLFAELRFSFDRKRFSYQKNPRIKSPPPTKLIALVSADVGRYVRPFLAKNPKNFANILLKVEDLDKNTPYHYHPNYSIIDRDMDKDINVLLQECREIFFNNYKKYTDALSKSK